MLGLKLNHVSKRGHWLKPKVSELGVETKSCLLQNKYELQMYTTIYPYSN